jgi:hypothetical protein
LCAVDTLTSFASLLSTFARRNGHGVIGRNRATRAEPSRHLTTRDDEVHRIQAGSLLESDRAAPNQRGEALCQCALLIFAELQVIEQFTGRHAWVAADAPVRALLEPERRLGSAYWTVAPRALSLAVQVAPALFAPRDGHWPILLFLARFIFATRSRHFLHR